MPLAATFETPSSPHPLQHPAHLAIEQADVTTDGGLVTEEEPDGARSTHWTRTTASEQAIPASMVAPSPSLSPAGAVWASASAALPQDYY